MKIFLLIISILVGCKPPAVSQLTSRPEVAVKKNVTSSECGEEKIPREDRKCGSIYKNEATVHCGVARYKNIKHKECRGYVPSKKYGDSRRHCPGRGLHCKPGEKQLSYEDYVIQHLGCGYSKHKYVEKIECEIPEVVKTCPLNATWNVETYNTCRHKKNTFEKYETCWKPGFEKRPKMCSLFATKADIPGFLKKKEETSETYFRLAMSNASSFYFLKGEEEYIACIIKRNINDDLTKDVALVIRDSFQKKFQKKYDPQLYDCNKDYSRVNIASYVCSDENSQECQYATNYTIGIEGLNVDIEDIKNVREQSFIKTDAKLLSDINTVEQIVLQYKRNAEVK